MSVVYKHYVAKRWRVIAGERHDLPRGHTAACDFDLKRGASCTTACLRRRVRRAIPCTISPRHYSLSPYD